jgi:hypothetical protein
MFLLTLLSYTGCPKNGVLTVHYGVEEITVNVRKIFKKFYWTYLLIWRSLKVALNRSIILKCMYEIVMTATSNRTYYHKVQDHSLYNREFKNFGNRKNYFKSSRVTLQGNDVRIHLCLHCIIVNNNNKNN